ncbi:hypothetical protein H632_c1484p0 [Helicosporidium sp. ATCC 50920]|nr:hypothetical protein H632_c1484p0 [Helicosporidium sp. ATCC 50920]|eukprot:KDD74215.1 hypothetical protein H632_c1484p0 [Helicosporidium sp. ATCC 50920]
MGARAKSTKVLRNHPQLIRSVLSDFLLYLVDYCAHKHTVYLTFGKENAPRNANRARIPRGEQQQKKVVKEDNVVVSSPPEVPQAVTSPKSRFNPAAQPFEPFVLPPFHHFVVAATEIERAHHLFQRSAELDWVQACHQGELQAQLATQRGELEAQMAAQRAEFEIRLGSQRSMFEGRLAAQRGGYEARLEAQRGGYEARLEAQRAEHQVEVAALQAGHAAELEAQKTGHAAELEAVEASREALQADYEALEASSSTKLEALQADYEALEASSSAKLKALEASSSERLRRGLCAHLRELREVRAHVEELAAAEAAGLRAELAALKEAQEPAEISSPEPSAPAPAGPSPAGGSSAEEEEEQGAGSSGRPCLPEGHKVTWHGAPPPGYKPAGFFHGLAPDAPELRDNRLLALLTKAQRDYQRRTGGRRT